MNIIEIFEEIRRKFPAGEPGANVKRGKAFEKAIKTFLQEDPRYKSMLADVWLWNEWPGRQEGDTGIDLVAREQSGALWAIQCKFYDAAHPLPKSGIDAFLATSGRYNFSRRFIFSTTDKWSTNAEKSLQGQSIPCHRVGLAQIADSAVEFRDVYGSGKARAKKKKLSLHQKRAFKDVVNGFKTAARGKLIMACGTGKTFTSLRIAEAVVSEPGSSGNILVLVPSISLLSQSLREWATEAELSQRNFAVCSDSKVGNDEEGMRAYELAFPTTTDRDLLAKKLTEPRQTGRTNIVFSTYHSIDVVAEAQRRGAPEFDLIICDEAHRTTGVEHPNKEISYFVKVHDNDYIKSKRRLYMTATPRIYSDSAKTKAAEHDIDYYSMDDPTVYGEEFHRLDFSDAVAKNLLADYRVLVLAVNEDSVSRAMQEQFAKSKELKLADAVKIIGCWNGLSKRISNRDEVNDVDSDPMRRAVAFSTTIKYSEHVTDMFSQIVDAYQPSNRNYDDTYLKCEFRHVDGKQNSLERDTKLNWLREDPPEDEGDVCRVLSNARCLSEGVDVPALDAVMFLNPRKSVVDVVQSVGRVMRKAEGKQYGYIILPVGVPAGVPAHEALKDNKKYEVVWEVLQALRAHDNRFNALINKLELNENRPPQIEVIGVGGEGDGEGDNDSDSENDDSDLQADESQLDIPFNIEEWRNAIYAKIVVKCGDRKYWETWAKDIAAIAEANTTRIKGLLAGARGKHKKGFQDFHKGLKASINPFISEDEAVEMLSQHLITKPVFNALFENYDFAAQNPVSQTMQRMVDLLEKHNLDSETATLGRFYDSVRERAEGIDNAEGKQRIIIELYDKFFKTAFPKMAERLGIVYTPVEIIDFILQSVQDTMKREFGKGLTDEGVDILDPFTGTGSFIVRMLQGDYINARDLQRKYRGEIHANEIVLLAYYIAAINIEEAYHARSAGDYEPFPGILLADTFQLGERKGETEDAFIDNFERADKQNKRSIRVIVGNPPYSAGQRSENDANKNLNYPKLDAKVKDTYAKHSTATLKNSLYDSYIRSIRWASDRIGDEGIVAFVSNGSYIDGRATDGMRKCVADEFTSVYYFNLRGNQRTSGEISKKEGGKIFGSGSRAQIAITLFVKNPGKENDKCEIYYHDIGDYLTQQQKLEKIKDFSSVTKLVWQNIEPNEQYDWINQRHPEFEKWFPVGDKENKRKKGREYSVPSVFSLYSLGVITARDAWAYNFSKAKLEDNMKSMIEFYNSELNRYRGHRSISDSELEQFLDTDPKKISWDGTLKGDLGKLKPGTYSGSKIRLVSYRPFQKQWLYLDRQFNNSVYRMLDCFPESDSENLAICVPGLGVSREFSVLMTNICPDLGFASTRNQCFPLYCYQEPSEDALFEGAENSPAKIENIPDDTLEMFQNHYGDKNISKIDIFYYVYGILHSPRYKTKYAADLRKMLPRIPLHKKFYAFSRAGKALGDLHVNYESVAEYPVKEMSLNLLADAERRVVKMKFAKQGKAVDKTSIVYNKNLILHDIPLQAYQYVVNGKSAIEWMMERYQVKTDKDSGIKNDPNEWSDDPNYIVKLLKKVVYVSVESVKIIDSLPEFES